ncbi:hypothetical protein [Shewanella sp. TC10]|uniref:hypothetical protein n=1 Tax=Shewanella sp. TC10 TaxID=1419739 RepID=UPI00129DFC02|nr:hypothetical protein [Shewanella sp. TC10]
MYKVLAIFFFLHLSGCTNDRAAVVSDDNVLVFLTEQEAALQGVLNRPIPEPIDNLMKGSDITVIRDTYGKDYWACNIRLPNKKVGWVLCTSLDFN